MKAEYITLTNGRKIRIEWNWNTVAEWTARTGKEITDLNDGKVDVSQMRTIAYCCALEGESMDGKELGLSELEFGRLVNMQGIVDFAKILTSQALMAEQKKRSTNEITKDVLQETGLDVSDFKRFGYASVKKFALGAMGYSPGRFGRTRVGDFLDAMSGHQELENERMKGIAEIIRTSTTILWNIHLADSKYVKKTTELWAFPWDESEVNEESENLIEAEEREKFSDDLLQTLKRVHNDKTVLPETDQQQEDPNSLE